MKALSCNSSTIFADVGIVKVRLSKLDLKSNLPIVAIIYLYRYEVQTNVVSLYLK